MLNQSNKLSSTRGSSIRRLSSARPLAGNSPQAGIAGITLVELMVAVFILGIVFTSAFGVLGQGFNMIETSRDYTRVAQILQSEMESVRTMNWAAITALPTSSNFTPDPEFIATFGDRYTFTRDIATPKVNQRTVVLTGSWQSRKGPVITRFYKTTYTMGGLNDFYIQL